MKQKLALFLNYVGEELYDIYDNLLVPTEDGTHVTFNTNDMQSIH